MANREKPTFIQLIESEANYSSQFAGYVTDSIEQRKILAGAQNLLGLASVLRTMQPEHIAVIIDRLAYESAAYQNNTGTVEGAPRKNRAMMILQLRLDLKDDQTGLRYETRKEWRKKAFEDRPNHLHNETQFNRTLREIIQAFTSPQDFPERYARLEKVVDQSAFAGATNEHVLRLIREGSFAFVEVMEYVNNLPPGERTRALQMEGFRPVERSRRKSPPTKVLLERAVEMQLRIAQASTPEGESRPISLEGQSAKEDESQDPRTLTEVEVFAILNKIYHMTKPNKEFYGLRVNLEAIRKVLAEYRNNDPDIDSKAELSLLTLPQRLKEYFPVDKDVDGQSERKNFLVANPNKTARHVLGVLETIHPRLYPQFLLRLGEFY